MRVLAAGLLLSGCVAETAEGDAGQLFFRKPYTYLDEHALMQAVAELNQDEGHVVYVYQRSPENPPLPEAYYLIGGVDEMYALVRMECVENGRCEP